MDIKLILKNIIKTDTTLDVSGLSLNTKTLNKGDVFVALQGEKNHGVEFIEDAIEKGCIAVLVDGKDFDCKVPSIRVDNLKAHLSTLAQNFYTSAKNVDLIAVTGTNGKTSVSHYISQLLDFMEIDNGVIGTLGMTKTQNKSINTTPDIFSIYSTLEEYSSNKVNIAVIEASSHALMQGRLEGLSFSQGIFTNLTQDHLDYHGTMDNYREAKGKLFQDNFSKKAIINRDDENHQYFLDTSSDKDPITFGIDDLEFYKNSENGFICQLNDYVFELPLVGEFNLSNAIAAYNSVKCLGFSDDQIIPCLAKLSPPPGRMQQLANSNIWIDYAHTPDALDNALSTLRTHYPEFNIRVIFGCGGDRDKGKRQMMGKIASERADSIILTNDNPRSEHPQAIIDDILAGTKVENDVQIILDRGDAIRSAIQSLGEEEAILIAGKGHETSQVIGTNTLPFSDIEVALNALSTLRTHYPEFNIRVIFGCGGDRDKGKRQMMGKIASENADSIILTNDNPRGEDPQSIIDDILAGTKVENDVQVILDRGNAIQSAIQNLGEEEVLLIAGKGHETSQVIGTKTLPFSDIEVALNALN